MPIARPSPLVVLLVLMTLAGCNTATSDREGSGASDPSSPSRDTPAAPLADQPQPDAPPAPAPAPVTISIRIQRRVADPATAHFEAVVRSTLTDARGWTQAGFELLFDDLQAPYLVVLAEGPEVDDLCRPYRTVGKYSCQNGPVVAINADRWRTATPEWTGDFATYREMLVNHEVGHLLGRHHPPAPQCPEPGKPALVMSQQSTELQGCLPNAWPRPEEVAAAARHDEPLAPPYQR